MRIETAAEVTPIVGSEQQSEELVKFLLSEFEEDPVKIWHSDIFGKSVHQLVSEGLNNKLYRMPQDARRKLSETVEKISEEAIINFDLNGNGIIEFNEFTELIKFLVEEKGLKL